MLTALGSAPLHSSSFGQSSFARHTLVHRSSAVKVPAGTDLALFAPLGFGMQTGDNSRDFSATSPTTSLDTTLAAPLKEESTLTKKAVYTPVCATLLLSPSSPRCQIPATFWTPTCLSSTKKATRPGLISFDFVSGRQARLERYIGTDVAKPTGDVPSPEAVAAWAK
ncbi:hypothetical protein B0T25DRAFT_523138 [Lasiosphaeria hispida]|uniref:Uncharacterized protein n=1 Tax=Lasiosphaeria hispida TaxID=260671 RepID=A0AAJ0M8R2_9PEZI|nr:hypothetical protein B0T25DRAFT_523138 [Lasiosphaeria hispida]